MNFEAFSETAAVTFPAKPKGEAFKLQAKPQVEAMKFQAKLRDEAIKHARLRLRISVQKLKAEAMPLHTNVKAASLILGQHIASQKAGAGHSQAKP